MFLISIETSISYSMFACGRAWGRKAVSLPLGKAEIGMDALIQN